MSDAKKRSIEEVEKSEAKIARSAHGSWQKAREGSLAAGVPIVIGSKGKLIQVMPNGDRKKIGTVPERESVRRPLKGKAKWTEPQG